MYNNNVMETDSTQIKTEDHISKAEQDQKDVELALAIGTDKAVSSFKIDDFMQAWGAGVQCTGYSE